MLARRSFRLFENSMPVGNHVPNRCQACLLVRSPAKSLLQFQSAPNKTMQARAAWDNQARRVVAVEDSCRYVTQQRCCLSIDRASSRRLCTSGRRHAPARDDCVLENPTFHPTYQSDTTGPLRHHRTSFLSNSDESDTTGPFRPNAATSLSLGRGFDPHRPYKFSLSQWVTGSDSSTSRANSRLEPWNA